MYKSRLCTQMHLKPGFSAQVFRDRADNRPNRRDMYMESSFCRCFPVQARLVHKPSIANQQPPPTNKNASQQFEAFGAENETRTIPYNALIINKLEKFEKASGETFVAFQGVSAKDRKRQEWLKVRHPNTPIRFSSPGTRRNRSESILRQNGRRRVWDGRR